MSEPEETRAVMPETRKGITHKVEITDVNHGGTVEGYITGNLGSDGKLREVFLHGFGREGSTMDGWTQFAAILLSTRLQSREEFVGIARRVMQMKFEPFGPTSNQEIPWAPSVPAYIMAWLSLRFGGELQQMWTKHYIEDNWRGRA